MWSSMKPYVINNLEDIVIFLVFLGLKVFNSNNSNTFFNSRKSQITSVEKQLKTIIFLKLQTLLSEKAFNGTVVNGALQSLLGGSFESTLCKL